MIRPNAATVLISGCRRQVRDIFGDITARDQFIKDNGCDTTNTQSVVIDANTTCTLYNVCTAGNYPVQWCPVTGGKHEEPTRPAAAHCADANSSDTV